MLRRLAGNRRTRLLAAFGVFFSCIAGTSAAIDLADTLPEALAPAGDPARGRVVMAGRDANCFLCHAIRESGERFMGDVGPPLSGIGARLNVAQLRLRVVDPSRLNPETVMPSYFRTTGLQRVAEAYRNRPILNGQQIEDVIAYLQTLR
jgi:L-cysteine S-thiosulfotransferase